MTLVCKDCGREYGDSTEMGQKCNACGSDNTRGAKPLPDGKGKTVLICTDCQARLGTMSIDQLLSANHNPTDIVPRRNRLADEGEHDG